MGAGRWVPKVKEHQNVSWLGENDVSTLSQEDSLAVSGSCVCTRMCVHASVCWQEPLPR